MRRIILVRGLSFVYGFGFSNRCKLIRHGYWKKSVELYVSHVKKKDSQGKRTKQSSTVVCAVGDHKIPTILTPRRVKTLTGYSFSLFNSSYCAIPETIIFIPSRHCVVFFSFPFVPSKASRFYIDRVWPSLFVYVPFKLDFWGRFLKW